MTAAADSLLYLASIAGDSAPVAVIPHPRIEGERLWYVTSRTAQTVQTKFARTRNSAFPDELVHVLVRQVAQVIHEGNGVIAIIVVMEERRPFQKLTRCLRQADRLQVKVLSPVVA